MSYRPHLPWAGTAGERAAVRLVRDEEDRARRVPDGAVAREVSRPLADNTAGIATWLDARELSRGGDLTRKRSPRGPMRLKGSPGRGILGCLLGRCPRKSQDFYS
jgi:hypothetical protein